ncbi:MAG: histidinol dehydrogenase [Sedimentisphaerales bacterium]|nr:histidinol dehydrogenase [Sedimentisphaerales bacterium]
MLDKIMIRSSLPNFKGRLSRLRKLLQEASYFSPGDENHKKLVEILNTVKVRKDAALIEYTDRFDKVKLTADKLRVSGEELKQAHSKIEPGLLKPLRQAIENVRQYQQEIFIGKDKQCSGGCGIKYTPVSRAGLCIPGASAPLPSTVIMTAVPAQVAGVEEIAVVSPPRFNGDIHPVILGLCYELGIEQVYRIGGAQAVAALAYGTETVKPVDKIVGPGNRWVQMAKKEVFAMVDIDSVAGPSEVLVIANNSANPKFVAADMLSQAEHAPGSALLFTNSEQLAKQVINELAEQVSKLSRAKETLDCLIKFGGIVVFDNLKDAVEQANQFAPEHLQIQCGDDSRGIADKIENAGAIFIGDFTPVAVGDYWAGPSHTLPTGQTARFFSPLSANDFIKSTSIIEYDKNKLERSSEDIIRLAQIEGLDAHANSVKIRTSKN